MINSLFQAAFFDESNIGSDEECNQLLKEIAVARTANLAENSNDGCIRSIYQYKNIDWLLDHVVRIVEKSIDHYRSLDVVFNHSSKDKKIKINYWTNINRPGSRNVLHSHSDADFSCVYYVQAEGTGDLRLINPANILGNCSKLSPFTRDFYFSPRDKNLICWPAWVPHEVEPNLSNKERINITFDIRLV